MTTSFFLKNKRFLRCVLFFVTSIVTAQTQKNINTTAQLISELEAIKNNTSSVDELILRSNTYLIDSKIELDANHNNLKISACGEVFLNGGLVLNPNDFVDYDASTSGFTLSNPSAASNIKVLDLSTVGITKSQLGSFNLHGYGFSDVFETPAMLWLDESKMDVARWPNKGEVFANTNDLLMIPQWSDLRSKVPGAVSYTHVVSGGSKYTNSNKEDGMVFKIDSSRDAKVNSWSYYKNHDEKIWLDGVLHSSWEWEYNQIEDINNTEIELRYGSKSAVNVTSVSQQQLAADFSTSSNVYNDYPNGLNIDAATKVSHFHFDNIPEELDMPGEYFIDRETMKLYFYPPVDWTSKKLSLSILNDDMISIKNANNITIENVTIEGGLKNGIFIKNSENVLVKNSIIRNFNQWGVRIEGENNTVDNCELYNHGAGGVKLGVEKVTDFHLNIENNIVKNSTIHDFAWDQKSQVPGITLSGSGNKAIGNEIYNAPHFAIKYRDARQCVSENNVIHDLPYYHHFDGGAVYLGLGHGFYNRENKVMNNVLYDVPTNGVYLDNYTTGNFVEGNFFYNVGVSTDGAKYAAIYNHGGGQNLYKDNIAVDCKYFMKTGSHIVKGGNTHKYMQSWLEDVESGGPMNPVNGAHYNDFISAFSNSKLAEHIGYLTNLPPVVVNTLPNVNSLSQWQALIRDDASTNYIGWDALGYNAMQVSSPSPSDIQWQNYMRVRYMSSTYNNNIQMHTDPNQQPTGPTGGLNKGDGKTFWEFSEFNNKYNKSVTGPYYSGHIANNNEALSITETAALFPNIIQNKAINFAAYPSVSITATNNDLNSAITMPLSTKGDKDQVSFSACPAIVCSGLGIEELKYQTVEACNGGTKVDQYIQTVTKDVATGVYNIDLSAGIDSNIISIFILMNWDSFGKPNGPLASSVTSLSEESIVKFVGDHDGFSIHNVDVIGVGQNCWAWNRRIQVELAHDGVDFSGVKQLELKFNPNNDLVSKNNEYYCPQTIKLDVKVNQPLSLDLNDDLNGLQLFPNPVKDRLYLSGVNEVNSFEMYSIVGKKVSGASLASGSSSIDVSGLEPGVYLVKIASETTFKTFTIVKE
ncbi:MAG: right-handed parallel beta-helix repeat-containing protein [Flavicella sp.]